MFEEAWPPMSVPDLAPDDDDDDDDDLFLYLPREPWCLSRFLEIPLKQKTLTAIM